MRWIILFLFFFDFSIGGCPPRPASGKFLSKEWAIAKARADGKKNDFDHIFQAVGTEKNIDSLLLKAIAIQESIGLSNKSIGRDDNVKWAKNGGIGYGLMQFTISSSTMRERMNMMKRALNTISVNLNMLLNPYVNVKCGAYILKNCMVKYKNSPKERQISAYNGSQNCNGWYYGKSANIIYQYLANNKPSTFFPNPAAMQKYPLSINGILMPTVPTPNSGKAYNFFPKGYNPELNDQSVSQQETKTLNKTTSPFLKMPWDLNPF